MATTSATSPCATWRPSWRGPAGRPGWEAACREAELPARQGGEEFVVLFDQIDPAQVHTAGERLRAAVAAQPFVAGELSLPLTVSIGGAARRDGDADFDGLLRRA